MNGFAVGFRWAMIAGILQDWFFAFAAVFAPQAVLELFGADPAPHHVWPAYAGLMLVLLSLFYVPAAVDPFRYGWFALLAVLARVGGVLFFFVVYPGAFPPLFGYFDAAFALVQGTLLALAVVAAGPRTPGR